MAMFVQAQKKKWMFLSLLCTIIPACAEDPKSQGETALETAPASKTLALNYETNFWHLYPRREAVYLQKLEPLSDGIGVRLSLQSDLQNLSHFAYATNEAPLQTSADGVVAIAFEDRKAPETQRTTTRIQAVNTSGDTSKSCVIDINFYPRELYSASGRTEPGWVIVQHTDLMLPTSRVEDWILEHPTDEEKAYAQKKWGHLMDPNRTDDQNALALARSLMDDLDPHRGIPSDEMNRIGAFAQYERVMAGNDRLWCGNIAAIFSYACNALGIPCRKIGMNRHNPVQPPEGAPYRFLLAEGHGTTEIFSEQLNQWVWIDLTFYILGAYLGEEGPLSMAELYHNLNAPARFARLQVVEYDPQAKTERRVHVEHSDKRYALLNYFKRDQEFHYTRNSGETAR